MNVSVCIEKRCPRCGGNISQDDEPYCIQCGWVDYKPSGDWRVIGRPSGIYHLCISKRAGDERRQMLQLVDGPCKGTYMCKRAPVFLRGVKGLDNAGNCDVLDQVDDTPNSGEKVYVYELQGEAGTVHLNFGGGRGGWYAMGSYHYLPDVDGEQLRDNVAWQEWALAQVKREGDWRNESRTMCNL